MSLLEKIVKAKRVEIEKCKTANPSASLEKSEYFESVTRSLSKSLLDKEKQGIIAEFKRKSPSRGLINSSALPENVCPQYLNSGASAVSVLTNREFFGGSNEDIVNSRKLCDGPILRKEFIIDEYQVVESKSIGADAILLIADILTENEMKNLSALAESLNMEVLFEVHDESGPDKLPPGARLTGINSRNLENFKTNLDILTQIINKLPGDTIKIAESGIHSAETLIELKKLGFNGFLIGEHFMKEKYPGKACRKFIQEVKYYGSVSS